MFPKIVGRSVHKEILINAKLFVNDFLLLSDMLDTW
jgi:hypothetical protein